MPSASSSASFLYLLLSATVFAASTSRASTGGSSASPVRPPESDRIPLLHHAQNTVFSGIRLFWSLICGKFERAIHGQLGLSDMVQLFALCSVIQSIRVWRGRCGQQREDSGNVGLHKESKAHKSRESSFRKGSKLGTFETRVVRT